MSNNNLALIDAKELSKVEDNSLNAKQLQVLLKKTPSQYVKTRPAKGGGQWEYVTGGYVKKMLNLMFGWDWDFEIMDEQILIEAKEVVVKGKLTCRTNGNTIVKMQYGNKDIVFKRNSEFPLSIGNDLKAASTDALKKCASEIGIAADIYNKEDFKEVLVNETEMKFDLETLEKLFEAENEKEKSELPSSEYMNIQRIIEFKEQESYKKAINLLLKL